jgi:uncharacterized membrane protein HdeD (DUF308 family)
MTMSVEAAAQALREATQATVRRYSTWYLIQGVLMVFAGIVAFLYPFVSSAALVLFLGWILIVSGIVQGYQSDRRAKRTELLASIGIGCPVSNCRRALSSAPR